MRDGMVMLPAIIMLKTVEASNANTTYCTAAESFCSSLSFALTSHTYDDVQHTNRHG